MAKKTYFWKDEKVNHYNLFQIRVQFHLDIGRIVSSFREFRKPASEQKAHFLDVSQNFVVDPYAKPMKRQHLFAQLATLLAAEQQCLHAVKVYERELSDILVLRASEENETALSISIYDTLRNDTVFCILI